MKRRAVLSKHVGLPNRFCATIFTESFKQLNALVEVTVEPIRGKRIYKAVSSAQFMDVDQNR